MPNTTRPTTKKPCLGAEPAYENAMLVAHDLLQRVGDLLEALPIPDADGQRVNWGHVGDVNLVSGLLSQAIAHLSPNDR